MTDYNDIREPQHLDDIALAEHIEAVEADALEDMMESPELLSDFMAYTGADVATVLSLLLRQGLPLRNGSETDDKRVDGIEDELTSLRAEFEEWARETGALEKWIGQRQEDLL